jgi:hypothetical protein
MPEPLPQTFDHVDLRNPWIAGLLAWLIPGAGHFYQRRWAKAILFFVCLTGTFYYGIALGSSRTVYMPRTKYDPRTSWSFLPQLAMGVHSFPAVLQCQLVQTRRAPILGNYMAPPVLLGDSVPEDWAREQWSKKEENGVKPDFAEKDFIEDQRPGYRKYAPENHGDSFYPAVLSEPVFNEKKPNQYSIWNSKLGFQYDLGVTFTQIAGLLNLLVIFDAACGPAFGYRMQPPKPKPDKNEAEAKKPKEGAKS